MVVGVGSASWLQDVMTPGEGAAYRRHAGLQVASGAASVMVGVNVWPIVVAAPADAGRSTTKRAAKVAAVVALAIPAIPILRPG